MSTTESFDIDSAVAGCRPTGVTPVAVEAESLETTAPEYLRTFKETLADQNRLPVELTVRACFETDCSLSTQREADRVREFVRAGSFLGVNRVTVTCDSVANPEKVRPALSACAERANREGLTFELDGPFSLES